MLEYFFHCQTSVGEKVALPKYMLHVWVSSSLLVVENPQFCHLISFPMFCQCSVLPFLHFSMSLGAGYLVHFRPQRYGESMVKYFFDSQTSVGEESDLPK
ncbi:hypothetical protein AVEN_267874-1 [Araneus ventricosus]|uniref:Uncharacterized protein n=1 Tax=Araneus ventricosus TaxID=182803 RepID=A0A4Y2XAY6_ARAVE|nr:hypothetical protein AVEN_267874-1 [Araneus ventricosus]